MYKVMIEKQCGCFKRSGEAAEKTFEDKDSALIHANEWASDMNDTYCKKHRFSVIEQGNDFLITVAMNG